MKTKSKEKRGSWTGRAKRACLYLSLLYLGFVLLLALNENYLVYPGSKYPRGNWEPRFEFTEVEFDSRDGTKLVGWYLPKTGATETVLVCHGNAENVAQSSRHSGRAFQEVLNANVFVFDYRGYGKSEGSPNQQGLLEDAEAAHQWLSEQSGLSADQIILVGHSIGGGPAVHLASKVGAKSLFLQRTFASLVEPAQEKYWFVPVSLIMQNRYPSSDWIRTCHVPLHQSHGDLDSLVSFESGKKLFECSPAPFKEFWVNEGKGHWDFLPREYWRSVASFIRRVNEGTSTKVEESELTESETKKAS